MSEVTVSIVVVSRDRPDDLILCLTGIRQLFYAKFEVIVVTDPDSARKVQALDDNIKLVIFDEPNISAARNRGIEVAAGEVIAFIDDDAVPEPTWLMHLAAPFSDPSVASAGGYVRSRNGISFQWTARKLDQTGRELPLNLEGPQTQIFSTSIAQAIKTEGTNCAIRRSALLEIGGFDTAFHFYLDETDVNMRLARAEHKAAVVPRAQVLHRFRASTRRRADRAPADLTQIGASLAVFSRKYAPDGASDAQFRAHRKARRQGLLMHMVDGMLEPADIDTLMRGFDTGWKMGLERESSGEMDLKPAESPFKTFKNLRDRKSDYVAGRSWNARALRKRAGQMVNENVVTTLFLFSPTALAHRERFTTDGVWERTGGLFGPINRDDRRFRWFTFDRRVRRDWADTYLIRHIDAGN